MNPVAVASLVVITVSIFLATFAYALYPAVLFVASRFAPLPKTRDADAELPTVTLVVAAYNEEDVIAEKIENSLALDYPDEKFDVVVFSDASDDRTDDIVESYADAGVELVRIEGRVGKTECQNRVVEMVDSDVIVFSDANSLYDSDAIRRLVARFTDGVGCVVGEIRHTQTDEDVFGESVFGRYNRLVKRLESRIGSTVKGNGAIYAVRREDYVPLPSDAISDFAELLAIRERGPAVKYAPDAVARERTAGSVGAECSRKIRITTRSWHTIGRHLGLLNPFAYGLYSFQLFTDTVLWWCTPLFLTVAFAGSVALAWFTGHQLVLLVLVGYAALIALGLGGWFLDRLDVAVPRFLHLPHFFLVGNYSLVVGGWNFLRGRNIVTWETMND